MEAVEMSREDVQDLFFGGSQQPIEPRGQWGPRLMAPVHFPGEDALDMGVGSGHLPWPP